MNKRSFSEFASLEWNAKDGLKAEKKTDALGVNVQPPVLEWPDARLWPLQGGSMLVEGTHEVLLLGDDGKLKHKWQRPEGEMSGMIPGKEGELICTVLRKGQKPVMLKLAKDGKTAWSITCDSCRARKVLHINGKPAVLQSTGNLREVWSLDTGTGKLLEKLADIPVYQPLWAGADMEFCYQSYDTADQEAYFNVLRMGAETKTAWLSQEFGALIGVDARSNGYGSNGSRITRVSPAKGYLVLFVAEGLVRGEGGDLYFSHWNADSSALELIRKPMESAPQMATIKIPDWINVAHNHPAWQLAEVDGARYRLRGRDPQSHVWHQLLYIPQTGTLVVQPPTEDKNEMTDRLQQHWTWAVMREGSIILPLKGEKALHLIRLKVE